MTSYRELAQRMVAKAEDFEKHLKKITSLNNELKERSMKILNNIEELVGKTVGQPLGNKCKCCFDRESTYILLPCGHANYCEVCATHAKSQGRCYHCRTRIDKIKKVFF